MILSKTAEYGVRVVLELAVEGPAAGYVPARELARRCDIPFHFLGKICHRMTRVGILASYKGPNGGVALARRPDQVTLLEVVEALDGLEGFDRCVLGLPFCGEEPCPVHEHWAAIKGRILDMLSRRTLDELVADGDGSAAAVAARATSIDDVRRGR